MIFGRLDLFFRCLDLYFMFRTYILTVWTYILGFWTYTLGFELIFCVLNLYFGCLNLYFGYSGRVGSGGRPGRESSTFGEKSILGICIWKKVTVDYIIEFWTWGNFTKKTRAEKCCILVCCMRRDLSYEIDSGPKTKTDYLSHKSVQFLKRPPYPIRVVSQFMNFQVTAATAAAATAASQELSPSGETPGVPRAGSKYPVRGNPSLRYIKYPLPISPTPPHRGSVICSARASLWRACKKKLVSGPPSPLRVGLNVST